MAELQSEFFARFSQCLVGRTPYPWQAKLFDHLISGNWPDTVSLPTGAGKSSIIVVWLGAVTWSLENQGPRIPRRLAWVVNRRVVVDQATEEANTIRKKLESGAKEVAGFRETLKKASAIERPLAVSPLRGELADNGEWRADPSGAAILVGTVDMIGSRLLFRGYRDGIYRRPQSAGLLGVDTLIVNDEAHLTPAFAQLLRRLEDMGPARRVDKPFHVMLVSATNRGEPKRAFEHDLQEDLHASAYFRALYEAPKRLLVTSCPDGQQLRRELVRIALAEGSRRTICFVEQPEQARDIADQITRALGDESRVHLLTGTMRGRERLELDLSAFRRGGVDTTGNKQHVLVATSAAEVGVDITSDRLVTQLVSSDRLLQRLGRLNRFGDSAGGEANIVYVPAKGENKPTPESRTLEWLATMPEAMPGWVDVSCRSVWEHPAPADSSSPEAATARLDERLIEMWAMTSAPVYRAMPAQLMPKVESWLHGQQDNDFPDTEICWRAEVEWLARDGVSPVERERVYEKYRVLPHERIQEPTLRVLKKLVELAAAHGETRILLQRADGSVDSTTVAEAAQSSVGDLAYGMVMLPAGCGGLDRGMWSADAKVPADDVADWTDSSTKTRRRWLIQRAGEGDEWLRKPLLAAEQAAQEEEPARLATLISKRGVSVAIPIGDDGEIGAYIVFEVDWRAAAKVEMDLDSHLTDTAAVAKEFAARVDLGPLSSAFESAGGFHDEGKRAHLWQDAMGGDRQKPKAKTKGRAKPKLLGGYRHELGSLVLKEGPGSDLALHLVASHHGHARPFFREGAYYPADVPGSAAAAIESAHRFERLQREWGPWGLAYLEAVFKAADAKASEEIDG